LRPLRLCGELFAARIHRRDAENAELTQRVNRTKETTETRAMNRHAFFLVWLIMVGGQLVVPGAGAARAQQPFRTTHQSSERSSASSKARSKPRRARGLSRSTEKIEIIRAQAGDTPIKIAARLSISADELAQFNGLKADSKLRRGQRLNLPPSTGSASPTAAQSQKMEVGKRIKFTDGTTLEVDDVWKQGNDLWFRRGNISNQTTRPVQAIEPVFIDVVTEKKSAPAPIKLTETKTPAAASPATAFLIYLVDGARVRADEVKEGDVGTWYRRGNLSIFLDRERIARIERDEPALKPAGWRERGWTSGNAKLDELIKTNGARFGVDPYLVFCVIEQESQFHVRAVSPKGARGLMQLMPGTMARYGVRNAFDAAANIFGGTQYLKGLLNMFSGRLDLVLASYNAGEGAVMTYGRRVPPYKETRDYVRRVSKRYGTPEPRNAATTSGRNDQ